MIPILFEKNETDFTSHGLCRLSDVISDEVYTEGNGQYELTFDYPISGENYDEIQTERIVGVYADDSKKIQGYRIYGITKPMSGVVTIYARHVSYDLSGHAITIPKGSYTPAQLMALAFNGTNFTGWSDIVTTKQVEYKIPISARALLGGVEGSILDVFGGEYEFDNFTVKLYAERGEDNGVVVQYGKNITTLVDEYNTEDVYTAILPYATYYGEDDSEQVVIGDKISFQSVIETEKTAIIDFSDRFEAEEVPTKAKLATIAQAYVQNNNPGATASSMRVSFVPLWYDGESEAVGLFDTITVRHTKLGVNTKVRVVAINYDFLQERITKITCGRLSANFVSTVINMQEETGKKIDRAEQIPSRIMRAVTAATEAITGNKGGYVILHEGADGKPYELLILDDPDITLAVNVWRWNLAGLGFSSSGYGGPYETAITADGQIVADFITTGTLQVLDSLGQIIFSANADTKAVQIAGFNVQSDKLTDTRTGTQTSSDYDVVPGSQYTQTVNIAPNQIDTTYDYWRYSEDTQSAFNAFYQWWLSPHRLRFRGDFRNDPDNPRRSESTFDPWGVNLYRYTATDPETMVSRAQLYPDALRIYNVSAARYTKLSDGGLEFFENGRYVGRMTVDGPGSTYNSGTYSGLAKETWKTLTSLVIPRGTWLVVLHASFQSNASATRRLILSASQDSGNSPSEVYIDYRNAMPAGVKTHCHVVAVRKVASDTTMYMNAYQGSSSTLSVDWTYQLTRIM